MSEETENPPTPEESEEIQRVLAALIFNDKDLLEPEEIVDEEETHPVEK